MRIDDLPAVERDEIRRVIAESRRKVAPTRFVSNADEASFVFYVLLVGAIGGLVAYAVVFGNPIPQIARFWRITLDNPTYFLSDPATAAVQLGLPVGSYALWRIAANYRGNGWAVTSFGFVHLIRSEVRIARYPDITKLEISRGVVGQARRNYTRISVTTRDGWKIDGYAGQLVGELKLRVPPDAKVIE